jgi:hypothetical protein
MNRKERRAAKAQEKKMVKEAIEKLTPDERLVLNAIVEAGSALTTAQLGEKTGLAQYQIEAALRTLRAHGDLILPQRQAPTQKLDPKFVLGALTIAPHGDGWIVLEDGERVGGVLRGDPPFTSKEAAVRYVEEERGGYEESLALGEFGSIARCKVIRQTDPELFARFEEVVRQTADEEHDDKMRAHIDAGTSRLLLKFATVELEVEGLLQRDAENRMSLTEAGRRFAIKETTGEDLQ